MRGKEVPLSFRSTKNKGEKGNLVDNDSSLREAAVASMAEIFLAGARGAADFAAFEDAAIAAGHSMMAEAMGRALEARDAELAAGRLLPPMYFPPFTPMIHNRSRQPAPAGYANVFPPLSAPPANLSRNARASRARALSEPG